MGIVWSFFATLLSSLLLSHLVLADIDGPDSVRYEPYSVRPDITAVQPKAHPDLPADWPKLKQAQVEMIAQLIESYPDRDLYFLGRDGEYLYDLAKLMVKNEPEALKRIHLLNISRANMQADHVRDYLAQEGISLEAFKSGKKITLVDTGFNGSISAAIREYFPWDYHSQLQTHLISSANLDYPSTRVFLSSLNPLAVKANPGAMQATILSYEQMPRYTDRSERFEKIGDHWEAMSKVGGAQDGVVSRHKASRYREDLAAFAETKAAQDLFRSRRLLWRQLERLRVAGKNEELKKVLGSLIKSAASDINDVEKIQREAIVRDFIEISNKNGRTNSIRPADFGLEKSEGYVVADHLVLAQKYPQWKKYLEDPVTQIPKLLADRDFSTLGAMIDVIHNHEVIGILAKAIGKTNPSSSPILIKFVETMLKYEYAHWAVAQYIMSQPAWKNHPEFVENLIEKGLVERYVIQYILTQPQWRNHPEWVAKYVMSGKHETFLMQLILADPYWKDHPEWVEALVAHGKEDWAIEQLLAEEHWKNNARLKELCGGQTPTVQGIRQGLKSVAPSGGCLKQALEKTL